MADKKNFEKGLRKLQARFLSTLEETLPDFESFLNKVKSGSVKEADFEAARMQAHKWSGAGKTFGFPELSKLALKIEKELVAYIEGEASKDIISTITKYSEAFITKAKEVLRDLELSERALDSRANAELSKGAINNNLGAKLLIADDDALIREFLLQGFGEVGYETVVAKDGIEAWQKVKDEKPDVMLLDIMMPKMDGMEVLDLIRKNKQTSNLKVILLTGRTQGEGAQESVKHADAYITKPFNVDDVIECVLALTKPD